VAQSEVEELDEVVVSWSHVAKGIPEDWKGVVSTVLSSWEIWLELHRLQH